MPKSRILKTDATKREQAFARRHREFPTNTCLASRHVHMIADALARGHKYHMIDEDPRHVAGSLYSVIGSLWKARKEIAKLKARLADK